MTTAALTKARLAKAARALALTEPAFAAALERNGPPPLWDRAPGFPTLIHIILEQQVSLASAQAAFDKLSAALNGAVTPGALLALDAAALKLAGFSRQKASYARALAADVLSGAFAPEALPGMSDDAARAALIERKGIGRWTADIYLLMVLRRPDVWPHGDLALAVAAQEVFALPARPTYPELDVLAQRWTPWRSVAARLLWHAYLRKRGR